MSDTVFPTTIDTFVDPVGTDDVSVVDHALNHRMANDAVLALETKVGTSTQTGTSGGVLFANSSNNFVQDNTNFNYNASTKLLTLGGSIVIGSASNYGFAGTSAGFQFQSGNIRFLASDGGAYFYISPGQVYYNSSNLTFANGGTPEWIFVAPTVSGQLAVTNGNGSAGVGLDISTNGLLKLRNTAFNADANLTVGSFAMTGDFTLTGGGGVTISAGSYYHWNSQTYLTSPADGQMNLNNNAVSAGIGLDFATDTILKIRTRAQTGYASLDALGYAISGTTVLSGTTLGSSIVSSSLTSIGTLSAGAIPASLITPATFGSGAYSFGTGNAVTLGTIELGAASDTTLSRSGAGVLAVEGVVLPSISSTNTITNKRNQPRIVSAASYTTNTGTSFDFSTCDQFIITAQGGALKFNNPSGTPVQGEEIDVRIKDDGTARALTYDTQFRASSDLALPSTTILSKTLYMKFRWNATDSKLDLLAVLNNF